MIRDGYAMCVAAEVSQYLGRAAKRRFRIDNPVLLMQPAQALADVGSATDDVLRLVLHDYFAWATTTISRYHKSADDVPNGLTIPHWSWDRLQV